MRTRIIGALGVAGLLLAALASAGSPADAGPTGRSPSLRYLHANYHAVRSCAATPAPGHATCLAKHLVLNAGSAGEADAKPMGKSPRAIQDAYKLTGVRARHHTVAIVDAYGYPNAARDLAVYRKQFGLRPCLLAHGCLRIINQHGGTKLPRFDLGWAQEQALDLDAVSAACPSCKIVLVQADSNSFANLGAGVDRAARQRGVRAISNSYGGGDSADSQYGHFYDHRGIALTASTGDRGYAGASFPASSRYVTAVGGTSLSRKHNPRGWKETVWSGGGSGCTTRNAAPSGQTRRMTHCRGRASADVSAVANPATGLAVYAPASSTASGWGQFGGTSLSAPLIAAVYVLSHNTTGYANRLPYQHRNGLFDLQDGSNGGCRYWCKAHAGWDGPTGLGAPNGTSAF